MDMNEARIPRSKLRPSQLFLLIAPFIYTAFALLTPPFQTPDEHQHLFRAWQLSEFQLIGERRGEAAGGVLPEALGRAATPEIGSLEPHVFRRVVERPVTNVFEQGTTLEADAPRYFNFLGSVLYSPTSYGPQVAAVWLGKAAALSVESIVRLGRLFNAGLAILLIYWAIRLIPFGRLALLFVALLPMSASASAAFGQDGLVIGGACLITAVGLRVACRRDWTRSDLFITAALAIVLTLAKIVYAPLAMIGGLPFAGSNLHWRKLLPPIVICVAAAALAAIWIQTVSAVMVPGRADIPAPGERLAFWAEEPTALLGLLGRTYIAHGPALFDSLFTFGWLNVGPNHVAQSLSILALAPVLLASDADRNQLTWQIRLWLALIAASVVLLISLALYLYWTPASADWVQGLQGRYFIPVAPVLLLALLPARPLIAHSGVYLPLLMVGANLASLVGLAAAYYR